MTGPSQDTGLGKILQNARVARGISREALARELNLNLPLLEAIETEQWDKVPKGRERPLARILARRLEVDLNLYAEAWNSLPGFQDQDQGDPQRDRMERMLMGAMTVGSLGILAWLLIPARNIKSGFGEPQRAFASNTPTTWTPRPGTQPYPVLGDVLPESPVNEQGVLLTFRSMDTCSVRIESSDGQTIQQTLRISEPWRLRVKGPFTLSLDNAGVVSLEVAGRRIQHGASVAEPWSGQFSEDGQWMLPERAPEAPPPTAPETDPETAVKED